MLDKRKMTIGGLTAIAAAITMGYGLTLIGTGERENKIRQYEHSELSVERENKIRQYEHSELSVSSVSVQKIPYLGREVLVRAYEGDKRTGANITVVGFIEGDYMRPREGALVPVTEINPISDATQKTEFSDLLRERGELRPINFWHD